MEALIRAPYAIAFTIACVVLVITGHPVWATIFFIMLVLIFS